MTINQLRAYTIAVLGLIGVIAFSVITGEVAVDTGLPEPLAIDGRIVTFAHTDDNTGEDLHIYTDQATYVNGVSHAEMYVAVANKSDKQDVELTAYFKDESKKLKSIWVATEVTKEVQEPIMGEQCGVESTIITSEGPVATTTCVTVQTGTSTKEVTSNVWAPLELFDRTNDDEVKSKKSTGVFDAKKKSSAFSIDENEVLYYKVFIEYPEGVRDEVLLEAHGSKGGYGLLL